MNEQPWRIDMLLCDPIQWLHEWQSLSGSLIALFAALITIAVLSWQAYTQKKLLIHEKEKYEDLQKSKRLRAKAELPDALSDICEYTENCMQYIIDEDFEKDRPKEPDRSMNAIKNAIQEVDPSSSRAIYELIVHYQIHNSRMKRLSTKSLPNMLCEQKYDIAKLRALTNRLFEFARDQRDKADASDLDSSTLKTGLSNAAGLEKYAVHPEMFRDVIEMIEIRHNDATD